MLGKVNRSHSSKYQIHFEISSLEQNTQKKLERIVLTSDRHRSSTLAQRLAIKRADHPSSYYHSGDGSPIFPSLVSRTSASSNHLKPSSMTEKEMLWAWQEKTIVRTNCWFLFRELMWGHTVTHGAALLRWIPFHRWQFGERQGSCYSRSCTDGWEKETEDIPYSKLN